MIRSFRELWQQISSGPGNSPEGPDLFDFARNQNDSSKPPVSKKDEKSKIKRKAALALLLSLYPVLFTAGYFTNHVLSDCSELKEALGMIPDLGNPSGEGKDTGMGVTPDHRRYLGVYNADVSGHKASLYIYALKTGGVGGYIRFKSWGRREVEYLKNIRITANRIEFIRSCRGQECIRIGSTTPMYQIYSGILNENATRIEGTYTGGQSASSWTAEKMQ